MKPRASSAPAGRVRIIAGRLRGSKIDVPDLPGLRPTSDRVRETLFNWLAPHLAGARCVDLFAGSGALGFEAASRGAAEVWMIEREPRAVAHLRATAQRLQAEAVRVEAGDALAWLRSAGTPSFDVAFVDPPFLAGLLDAGLAALAPRMAKGAFVYVESPRDSAPAIPDEWALHREGHTREVRYALYRVLDRPATLAPG